MFEFSFDFVFVFIFDFVFNFFSYTFFLCSNFVFQPTRVSVSTDSIFCFDFDFDYRAFSNMDFWSNTDMSLTRFGRNKNRKSRPGMNGLMG